MTLTHCGLVTHIWHTSQAFSFLGNCAQPLHRNSQQHTSTLVPYTWTLMLQKLRQPKSYTCLIFSKHFFLVKLVFIHRGRLLWAQNELLNKYVYYLAFNGQTTTATNMIYMPHILGIIVLGETHLYHKTLIVVGANYWQATNPYCANESYRQYISTGSGHQLIVLAAFGALD